MKFKLMEDMFGRALALVEAALLGVSGAAWAQSPVDVQVTQTVACYVAGAPLVIECAISYPAGSQVQSLLWTPALPEGWTLIPGSATGNGDPEIDPDGQAVVFNGPNLSQYNPLVFRYSVAVPAGEYGKRSVRGTLDFQLVGMANPAPVSPAVNVLTDADAAHGAIGYLAGTPMTVTCSFSRPAGVVLQSLLWRPELPAGWTLASGLTAVSGDGNPEVDSEGEAIILNGDLTASVLTFTYAVNVPADARGPKSVGGSVEYQLQGMANPVTTRAEPDPLTVRPMHTLQIATAYGAGQPAAGIYTNYYGSLLTNRVSASDTVGAYTYGCAGWMITGNEPVSGTGTECQLTITNNASLAWVWVAPAVGARTVDELKTLAFLAGAAYSDPAYPPLSLAYSLDAASVARGMSITAGGAFSWTPTEEQGGQANSVTVTVTDSGAGPHWLTASETFTVTAAEVNRAPTLGALSDRLADAASTLTFTATATDPDVPAQTLAFSLDAASLALGMVIDPTSGVFTWSPTVEQAGVAGQSYTVQVTVTDSGSNLANLSDTKSFTVAVADSRGTHATAGYLQGRTAKIDCTFEHPANKALLSLLWRPILPAGWELLSVVGQAEPEIDRTDGTIVFAGGGLNAPNPLTFSYMVSVPAGVTGPQTLRAQAEYQTVGMANPVTVPVNPDPLLVPELHTFEVVSAEGHCVPGVGVYTNLHGAALSASVSTPFTSETRTFACTGWTMTGIEPAAGPGDSVSMTLTKDAVLTWNWVSPLIAPATAVSVTMDEDNAPVAWVQPALSASEPYRPELVSGLAWSLLTPPAHGAATVTGTGASPAISYEPSANWYGSDSFVVQVSDGLGGFDHVTVNVMVNPVNDAPVLGAIGSKRTDEFTPLSFTVSATDLDLPAQNLTYTMSGAPAGAALDPSTGAFTWTPVEGQAGAGFAEFGVTVTVTDSGTYPDGQTDSEAFTITLDSSRATHSTLGYRAGQPLTVDCSFQYPATGRQLQSMLWVPELPVGWTVVSASGQGDPLWEPSDGAFVLQGADLPTHNPVTFSYVVLVPPGTTGTNRIGGTAEYQLNGMPNPATVRAQPDLLVVPMLLTLPQLVVADKVYDGLTNATVVTYGSLSGLMAGHEDVALVTAGATAYFDTPTVGAGKVVTVGGLALSGADAGWYSITTQMVAAAITQAPLTVTADPQTKTYGAANPTLTFQYSGFVNGETAAVLDTAPTASTTVTPLTGAGTHVGAITVSGGADINYSFTYLPADFTITKAPSVTAVTVNGGPFTYSGAAVTPATVSVTGAGGLNLTPAPAYANNVGAGTATASYSYAGDANHEPSADSKSFEIGKASATIAVAGATVVYDGAAHGATGTATSADGVTDLSGLLNLGDSFTDVPGGTANWTFAGDGNHVAANGSVEIAIGKAPSVTAVTVNGGPFTYSGAAVTPATVSVTGAGGLNLTPAPAYANNVGAGTATASYSYAGDANHEPSADSKSFEIGKASATIAVAGATVVYDGAAHGATGTATSADGVTDLSGLLNLGDSFTDVPGGTANWTFAGDGNHVAANGSVEIAIGKAPSVTAVTVNGGPFTYSGAAVTPATVSVTGAGGLNLTPAPAYANNVGAGTATASYSYAGDANHEPSADSKSFEIGKASATIAVAGATVVYDGAAHGATGTATSADGVTDLSGLLNLGDSFTDVPGGTANWTFAGDGNHVAANGSVEIAIGKAPSVTAVTVNGGPFTYSGAAVTPATVSVTGAGGLNLTPAPAYANNVGAGTATASYSYAGDANHEPSADSKSFEIGKASATIAVAGATVVYDGAAHGATGTATSADGVTDLSGLLNLGDSFTDVPGGTANWTFAGDGNHVAANGSVEIAIGKAPSVTAVTVNGGPFTYSGAAVTPATVSVTGAGGLNLTPAPAYANNVGAGTATASYSYAGDANHEPSADSKSFEIGKASATIAVAGATVVYDGAAHGATGTATSADGVTDLSGLLNLGDSFTDVPGGTANWTFAGDGNHVAANGSVEIAITAKALAVGGSFEVANKAYDGTAAVTISVNGLTLLTPVDGDDVTLSAVAVFDSAAVGAGKTVSLSAATLLSGADAGNYTLSLAGAPTATADILFPAVAAEHAAAGAYSAPSLGKTTVSNSFAYPAEAALTSLSWRPALLPGWSVYSVAGDGSPTTDGTNIVFQNAAAAPHPLRFTYTLGIPGGAPATNYLSATATFGLSSMMTGTLEVPVLHLLLRKYHSADYQTSFGNLTPNWKIDSFEANTFLKYWRTGVGEYHVTNVTAATPDGFDVGAAGANAWFHSGDFQTSLMSQVPDGKIDAFEVNRVLKYWRTGTGVYHGTNVTFQTPDGYDTGAQ